MIGYRQTSLLNIEIQETYGEVIPVISELLNKAKSIKQLDLSKQPLSLADIKNLHESIINKL